MSMATRTNKFSLRCLDKRMGQPFLVDKKKTLIGSSDKCDFILLDKSISSLHAFICLSGEGFMVKDLYSESGLFVNGKRVDEASIFAGDTISFGTISFIVEAVEDEVAVFNPDADIISLNHDIPYIELPTREGLVFIDGEYCDIEFDDSRFVPLTSIPNNHIYTDYVDIDESQIPLDIVYETKNKRLEIISYVNGLMMDISYLGLKNGDYYLSPVKKSKYDILFHGLNKSKIFSIQNGSLKFYASADVTPSISWDKVDLSETLFLSRGTEQISFRLIDHSTNLRNIPAFYRDRDFFKQSAKVFAGAFLPMLLLLFVTIPKDTDIVEEIAVVYKLPEKVVKPTEDQEKSELKAEELTSKTENTGHKETEQPKQKVEFAQASQNQKVQAKATAPAAAAKKVETAPVKAYEFKSSVAFNSVVGDAPKINTEGSSSKNAVNDASFNSGSSDTGALVAGANIGVSKFNGSDSKGSGSGSYGSRGLASKSGFDSSYLEPKTVVLGSMDPELLRKILREYIPQFRHCYQQELIATSDKIKGVIDLNFTISESGKVSKYAIKVKDAAFSKKGVGCMGQVLGLIDFPKPKGGGVVDVRQPLNFFSETEKI